MESFDLEYKPYEVICREKDESGDLYFLKSGKLLICTVLGTQVKTIARISPGEFIGELSFFDGQPRASHVVTIEKSVITHIPKQELLNNLPFWFIEVGKNLTKKIRLLDHIVQQSNFRKGGSEDQKPLTIEEQRQVLAVLTL